jgi:hypothetical protein
MVAWEFCDHIRITSDLDPQPEPIAGKLTDERGCDRLCEVADGR